MSHRIRERTFLELTGLTFNIFFQGIIGVGIGRRLCPVNDESKDTLCLDNVVEYINSHGPYDFVALQEASRWDRLIEKSPLLQQMNYVEYQPARESMVTFYDRRFNVDFVIKSYCQDSGRPFICIFFEDFVLINVHPGHKVGTFEKRYDFFDFDRHLERCLLNEKPGSEFIFGDLEYNQVDQEQVELILERLRTDPVVLCGDTNVPFDQLGIAAITLFQTPFFNQPGRAFTGFHNVSTCCSIVGGPDRYRGGSLDQILVTRPNLVVDHEIPSDLQRHSDHKPVIVKVLIEV